MRSFPREYAISKTAVMSHLNPYRTQSGKNFLSRPSISKNPLEQCLIRQAVDPPRNSSRAYSIKPVRRIRKRNETRYLRAGGVRGEASSRLVTRARVSRATRVFFIARWWWAAIKKPPRKTYVEAYRETRVRMRARPPAGLLCVYCISWEASCA